MRLRTCRSEQPHLSATSLGMSGRFTRSVSAVSGTARTLCAVGSRSKREQPSAYHSRWIFLRAEAMCAVGVKVGVAQITWADFSTPTGDYGN